MQPGTKVRVRESFLKAVKSYQIKALNYRRLVGVVTSVIGPDRVQVDFAQADEAPMPSGFRPGARASVMKTWDTRPGYPTFILETVDDEG